MVNFSMEPNPFEDVDMSIGGGEEDTDKWGMNENVNQKKLIQHVLSAAYRPSQNVRRSASAQATYVKVIEENSQGNSGVPINRTTVGKKTAYYTCEASSYDDTASTLSMSIGSDENTKSSDQVSKNEVLETSEAVESEEVYYDEPEEEENVESPEFYEERDDVHEPEDLRPQTNRSTSPYYERMPESNNETFLHDAPMSRFYDRLAKQETKSASLRRSSRSQSMHDLSLRRRISVSRDPSPLHERLAQQHTYATESRLSYKAPVEKTVPFHNVVRSDSFNGTEVASISMLPNEGPPVRPRRMVAPPRDGSPLHERLANHHTLSSIQKQKQLVMGSPKVRHSSPKPFYTVVTGSANSITDDVSALTKPSFEPLLPAFRRHRNVPAPPPPRYSSNRARSSAKPRTTSRPAPVRSSSQKMKSIPRGQQQKVRGIRNCSQDALYHRLSRQDTVASSRMKPLPLDGKILLPYEKIKRAEADSSNRLSKGKTDEVYNRLSSRGTKASIRKQMMQANPRYNSEHETFSEGCKNALMRNFKGSTFVRV